MFDIHKRNMSVIASLPVAKYSYAINNRLDEPICWNHMNDDGIFLCFDLFSFESSGLQRQSSQSVRMTVVLKDTLLV